MRVVSSLSLGTQQWVRVIQVGTDTLLIGQTAQAISLLKAYEGRRN